MYNNNCVIAILHKGKVLRETGGQVHLPFGSEYKIRAKNTGWGRVKVRISVDGTYIHPEDQSFVIDSGDHMDLERMITDGNWDSGSKLKFVSLSDGQVQDPTNAENGVVKVEFYREKDNPVIYIEPEKPTVVGFLGYDVTCNVNYASSDMSNCSIGTSLTNNGGGRRLKSKASNGATIEGSKSNQKFTTTDDFETHILPNTLSLTLMGLTEPKFVKNTRNKFCTHCGIKNRAKDKFCSNCGCKF